MTGFRLTQIAHEIWSEILLPGDAVVDATAGNGQDTVFLASKVGISGTVFAFDVQDCALSLTKSNVKSKVSLDQVPKAMHYILDSHSNIEKYVHDPVRLICFNFGYLPGGDKEIVTREETTIQALESATKVLMKGGLLSCLSYTGHPGGKEEYQSICEFLSRLSTEEYISTSIQSLNRPSAPKLLLAWKKN